MSNPPKKETSPQKTIKQFIEYVQNQKRYSKHTILAYNKDLQQFFCFLQEQVADIKIENIKASHLQAWIYLLHNQKIAPKSIRRKIAAISSFCKYSSKGNPALNHQAIFADLDLPIIRKKLPKTIQENQINQVLDQTKTQASSFEQARNLLIIAFFYATGMRLAELTHITLSQINTTQNSVQIIGKNKKERLIPYPKELNQYINNYLEQRQEILSAHSTQTNVLLLTNKATPAYEKMLYRIVKQYFPNNTPHTIRHSYATHLLNRGAELLAIQKLLGHSSLAATQIYTHVNSTKLNNAYKQAHPRG